MTPTAAPGHAAKDGGQAATSIHFEAGQEAAAMALAARLSTSTGAPYRSCAAPPPRSAWQLYLDAGGIALSRGGETHPLRLAAAPLGRRRARGLGLARACGAGPGVRLLDATAGWGIDGLTLAGLGCAATLVERSPIVYALLEDRARRSGVAARIEFGDSQDWMAQGFDVIYLDPMFETRRKPALPGKALQLLRQVAGAAPATPSALLRLARSHARRRVVLKRRVYAKPLAPPDWQIQGRTVRFDVYLPT